MTAADGVLIAIISGNIIISLLGFRALRENADRPVDTFLFVPHQVARGENGLGMLLAHFSHTGFLHLGFNMFALYSFAPSVLQEIGPAAFLLIYVVAGLGADLVVFALNKDDPSYRCLGASGSVFGIVMAAVVLDPSVSIVLLVAPIPIPGPVFMLGYVTVSLILMIRRRRGGISHEGHLGGTVAGLALAAVLAPAGLAPLVRWFTQWLGA